MFRLAVALLLLAVLPARANLGESVADCIKRYGKPTAFAEANAKLPFGTLVFMAGPYQMIVFLSNNVEVGARVTKKDKSAFDPGEMKTIMDADASTPWVATTSTDPNTLQWTRADKSTALYDRTAKMIIFTSTQMAEIMRNPPPIPAAPSSTAATPPPKSNVTIAPPVHTQWDLPSTNAATNAPAAATP